MGEVEQSHGTDKPPQAPVCCSCLNVIKSFFEQEFFQKTRNCANNRRDCELSSPLPIELNCFPENDPIRILALYNSGMIPRPWRSIYPEHHGGSLILS